MTHARDPQDPQQKAEDLDAQFEASKAAAEERAKNSPIGHPAPLPKEPDLKGNPPEAPKKK